MGNGAPPRSRHATTGSDDQRQPDFRARRSAENLSGESLEFPPIDSSSCFNLFDMADFDWIMPGTDTTGWSDFLVIDPSLASETNAVESGTTSSLADGFPPAELHDVANVDSIDRLLIQHYLEARVASCFPRSRAHCR